MMFETLRRLLLRQHTETDEHLLTPKGKQAAFELRYGDLPVGTLTLNDGTWTFQYSEDFRKQKAIQPLVAFADTDRKYESETLWPFFIARIPSVGQPQVRETIEREGLDQHSDLDLLRRFGRRTIANPFELIEAHR